MTDEDRAIIRRTRPVEWAIGLGSLATMAGMIAMGLLWLTGVWAAPIQSELKNLALQMDRVQGRVELLPRIDQVQALDAHTHALDGRMDALETRIRGLETDTARVAERVRGIEDASRASVGRR